MNDVCSCKLKKKYNILFTLNFTLEKWPVYVISTLFFKNNLDSTTLSVGILNEFFLKKGLAMNLDKDYYIDGQNTQLIFLNRPLGEGKGTPITGCLILKSAK